jgi:DNA-binding CsgD family transcriptional regulator
MPVEEVTAPLTRRQMQVMELLVAGNTYQQAAAELGLSRSTVRSYVHQSYLKLGVGSIGPALLRMQELGWMAQPEPPPKDPCKVGGEVVDYYPDLEPLTPAQRLYLQAFDRYLAAPADSPEEDRARSEMRYMLGAMYIERDLRPTGAQVGPAHRCAA